MSKVSVIVPVYNMERYLGRCVDSILAQTFADFDLVLVDDGSVDSSGAVCDGYAARDARVKVIHQVNGGLSAARNAGVEWACANSESEFLTFVDSDDWVSPGYLAALRGACVSCGCAVASVGVRLVPETSPVVEFGEIAEPVRWSVEEYWLRDWELPSIACAKMFRKTLFKDVRFPIGRLHEDEFTTHRLVFKEKSVAVIESREYFYFRRTGSISMSAWSDRRLDAIDGLDEQIAFFEERGMVELAAGTRARVVEAIANMLPVARSGNASRAVVRRLKSRLGREFRVVRQRLREPVRKRALTILHPFRAWIARQWRRGLRGGVAAAEGRFVRFCSSAVARAVARRRSRARMKLGVAYNLFDGEELLAASARSIRPAVDFIVVIYQNVSNLGELRGEPIEPLLERLRKEGLIDAYYLHEPDLGASATDNERCKRMSGMAVCRANGCTHFIGVDVDEFFRADELRAAREEIRMNGVDVSAVSVVEYVKAPEYRLLSNYLFPPGQIDYCFYMPFIMRIRRSLFWEDGRWTRFPCLADPTRGFVRSGRFYLFPKHQIAMHHMSTVRRDLNRKYRNSTYVENGMNPTVERMIQLVESFDFEKSRTLPDDFAFLDGYPVVRVFNEFGVDVLG